MKVNVFKYLNYRKLIRKRSESMRVTLKSLADAALTHSSYFSRVLAGQANFSAEQLFLIGEALHLNKEEMQYLDLLLQFEASGNQKHRSFVRTQIDSIRNEKLKIIQEMKGVKIQRSKEEVDLYYQEVITAKIHMHLEQNKFQNNPNLLAEHLHISLEKYRLS